ncbi:TnsA endonuclease N-terminal domain-containing protein [Nodularia spumigena]|uniref:TnsA endonuclease N-terminal domain-containing protein n=1 Tax=Nodularia spumigena TaxID=70799 RepID=UPI00232DEA13|nr:TnsA endonuclease N-terminal domain-containing protein [Nodularia spumigena]MDB9323930.1 TnsA endonuclease N-terminal domain-containing protein [Nodularia spumigena CS-591/07A]MDB9329296.1 TnsA endonuclease N-terminal domain-containing protein [Nodularia spumigena CS-591/04]MDB9336519.1 TnsA endonuclease N-terminal domain-containing protein [Nodularia spumigena CS-590/01]MDB9361689.1 TnsA endonuclease N-terminal domain-containing protein [Nodularia spumigena CS-588/02]MDB9364657.1 TnsA endo
MYLLEIDPDVLSYMTQPFKISYILDDKVRRYTPDFLVQRQSKKQIVEIKPSCWLDDETNVKKFSIIASTLKSEGWEFVIITDEMMSRGSLLNNVKLLYRYAKIPLKLQNLIVCQQYFQDKSPINLFTIIKDLEPQGINKPILFKLIFLGFLTTDLMTKLKNNSPIYLSSKAYVSGRVKND